MKEDAFGELRKSYGKEFHSVGHVGEKSSLSKGFCFVKGMRKACVRNRVKLSGLIVDSEEFKEIDFQ